MYLLCVDEYYRVNVLRWTGIDLIIGGKLLCTFNTRSFFFDRPQTTRPSFLNDQFEVGHQKHYENLQLLKKMTDQWCRKVKKWEGEVVIGVDNLPSPGIGLTEVPKKIVLGWGAVQWPSAFSPSRFRHHCRVNWGRSKKMTDQFEAGWSCTTGLDFNAYFRKKKFLKKIEQSDTTELQL